MEVFPQNTPERTMAVITLVFALVAFSSFVGSITGSMAQLRNINAERDKQFWMLRRYLKQNDVPTAVSQRLLKYLQYICNKTISTVQRAEVKVVNQLSEQLREELEYHMIIPKCSGHLLFGHCSQHMEVPMRTICSKGMTQKQLASGDILFYASDLATHCYFFLQGELMYKRPGICEAGTHVETRECISEATLWSQWHHRGNMRATGESDMIALSVEKFIAIMSKHEDTWSFFSTYARIFVQHFEEHCFGSLNDPSDLIRINDFHMDVIKEAVDSLKERSASSHLELGALQLTLQELEPRGTVQSRSTIQSARSSVRSFFGGSESLRGPGPA